MTLVIDAGVAMAASFGDNGFAIFRDHELAGPPLMWSEARSTIHLRTMLGSISREAAEHARTQLEQCPVRRVDRARLGEEAWRVADEFGWGRTYDAEYVALARLLGCRLMTLDARLRRGTDRLGFVIGPDEL